MNKDTIAMLWDVCDLARAYQCYAPEMATLFVLKFSSDNAEKLGVHVSSLNSFNSLVELYVSGTIHQADFSAHCRELLEQTSLSNVGAADNLSQFIATSHYGEQFKKILHRIKNLDFSDSPADCWVADFFLAYLEKDIGWDGMSKSSTSTAQLMSELAVKDSTCSLYDGVCGYGIALAHAYKNNPGIAVYGQEIKSNCAIVASALQWLLFNQNATIRVENTLRSPLPSVQKYPETFDSVIIDPPFAFRFEDVEIESFPDNLLAYKGLTQRRGDWFFIQHALAVLNQGGIAVVQASMATLFATGKAAEIRKSILADKVISAIIEFPAGMIPGAAVPVSMIVLEKATPTEDVLLVNMASEDASHYFGTISRSNTTLTADGISFVVETVRNRAEVKGISKLVSIPAIMERGCVLTPSAYLTKEAEDSSYVPLDRAIHDMDALEQQLAEVNNKLAVALADIL